MFGPNFFPYRSQVLYRYPDTYPKPDIGLFQQSAQKSQKVVDQVNKLTQIIATSDSFAYNIMDAAQRSQTEKVKQLIREIGIEQPVDIVYNPDGIMITIFSNNQKNTKISTSLQWR